MLLTGTDVWMSTFRLPNWTEQVKFMPCLSHSNCEKLFWHRVILMNDPRLSVGTLNSDLSSSTFTLSSLPKQLLPHLPCATAKTKHKLNKYGRGNIYQKQSQMIHTSSISLNNYS